MVYPYTVILFCNKNEKTDDTHSNVNEYEEQNIATNWFYFALVVLVSGAQRSESVLCIYTCLHSWTSLLSLPSQPSRSSQSTELSSLRYTLPSHLLSVLHMLVYMCQPQYPSSPHLLYPLHCVHTFVYYICISIPALQIGSSVSFF